MKQCFTITRFGLMLSIAGCFMLVTLILQGITMITVEKSDPFSSDSLRLIELLSAELVAITGDNGKSNFTAEAMSDDKALWALAKNSQGKAIG